VKLHRKVKVWIGKGKLKGGGFFRERAEAVASLDHVSTVVFIDRSVPNMTYVYIKIRKPQICEN
jgi:hypothetical protein